MSAWEKYLILASSFSVLLISFGIGLWAKKKVTSPEAFFGGAKIFGPLTVGQPQQEFLGAVTGGLMLDDLGCPYSELGGQVVAEGVGQVGHLVKAGGPAGEEPAAHLPGPIAGQPALGKPVGELCG